ncbi:MAG: hypothetical protein LBU60_02620 [Clostridiales bacterium]|jgi:hypothetical protein|nr:hypothetical protein [Clostridiales bacterium]
MQKRTNVSTKIFCDVKVGSLLKEAVKVVQFEQLGLMSLLNMVVVTITFLGLYFTILKY